MDTRRIGSLEVSIVGLGCNNFGPRLDAAGTAASHARGRVVRMARAAALAPACLLPAAFAAGCGHASPTTLLAAGA